MDKYPLVIPLTPNVLSAIGACSQARRMLTLFTVRHARPMDLLHWDDWITLDQLLHDKLRYDDPYVTMQAWAEFARDAIGSDCRFHTDRLYTRMIEAWRSVFVKDTNNGNMLGWHRGQADHHHWLIMWCIWTSIVKYNRELGFNSPLMLNIASFEQTHRLSMPAFT